MLHQAINDLPVGIDEFHLQRHAAQRVRRAGKARVEGAQGDLDVIQQSLGEAFSSTL